MYTQGFIQDENIACHDLGTVKYYSSAWSAVSERPNLHARLISNAPGRARDSFLNVPIRAHDHKTNKQLLLRYVLTPRVSCSV